MYRYVIAEVGTTLVSINHTADKFKVLSICLADTKLVSVEYNTVFDFFMEVFYEENTDYN